MFRWAEVATFSIFFVFSFIKSFSFGFVNIDILTYTYYAVILLFLARYYLIDKPLRLHFMFLFLIGSIVWLVLLGLLQVKSETAAYDKLRALLLSVTSIPVAVYMFRRNLLKSTVVVTTIFLLLMSAIFSVYVTYDETDAAYVLNEVYLHGSFISGFMIFLAILLRLPPILPVVLTACLFVFGGRGPLLALVVVSIFFGLKFALDFVRVPRLKKSSALFSFISLPILFSGTLYVFPNLFDRMLARWAVFFSSLEGDYSAARRIEHFFTSIAAFDSSPFIGIGLANYGLFLDGYHSGSSPHNFILEVLLEGGLLGGLPFLFCVSLVLIKSTGNKTWPLLLYVLFTLQLSYSYASSNELYFSLTLAILFTGLESTKNEGIGNHSCSSVGRYSNLSEVRKKPLR